MVAWSDRLCYIQHCKPHSWFKKSRGRLVLKLRLESNPQSQAEKRQDGGLYNVSGLQGNREWLKCSVAALFGLSRRDNATDSCTWNANGHFVQTPIQPACDAIHHYESRKICFQHAENYKTSDSSAKHVPTAVCPAYGLYLYVVYDTSI